MTFAKNSFITLFYIAKSKIFRFHDAKHPILEATQPHNAESPSSLTSEKALSIKKGAMHEKETLS